MSLSEGLQKIDTIAQQIKSANQEALVVNLPNGESLRIKSAVLYEADGVTIPRPYETLDSINPIHLVTKPGKGTRKNINAVLLGRPRNQHRRLV